MNNKTELLLNEQQIEFLSCLLYSSHVEDTASDNYILGSEDDLAILEELKEIFNTDGDYQS